MPTASIILTLLNSGGPAAVAWVPDPQWIPSSKRSQALLADIAPVPPQLLRWTPDAQDSRLSKRAPFAWTDAVPVPPQVFPWTSDVQYPPWKRKGIAGDAQLGLPASISVATLLWAQEPNDIRTRGMKSTAETQVGMPAAIAVPTLTPWMSDGALSSRARSRSPLPDSAQAQNAASMPPVLDASAPDTTRRTPRRIENQANVPIGTVGAWFSPADVAIIRRAAKIQTTDGAPVRLLPLVSWNPPDPQHRRLKQPPPHYQLFVVLPTTLAPIAKLHEPLLAVVDGVTLSLSSGIVELSMQAGAIVTSANVDSKELSALAGIVTLESWIDS